MSGNLAKRFHRKVSPQATPGGCREWTAANNGRYGIIRSSDAPYPWLFAHRVAYELHFGKIPEGLHVMHKCDNPLCVNWEHLDVGTRQDNTRDMVSKDRQKRSAFSVSDMEQVRSMRSGGATQQQIADEFGVSRPLVSMLLSGKVSRLRPA
jgi:hypothetical protein